MITVAHCQKRARELAALAERDPTNCIQHRNDAAAWLLLASRMEQMELRS